MSLLTCLLVFLSNQASFEMNEGVHFVDSRTIMKYKDDHFLIDVRNRESFTKCHISGSLNIPLFELKTKSWLRSKKVVLINEGIQAPLKEASYLQAMGVSDVSILKDGLYGWHLSGGELKGDAFTYSRLGTVEASYFATMTEEKQWLFICLFEDEKAFSSHEFLNFPAPNNSDELVTQCNWPLRNPHFLANKIPHPCII